MVRSRRAGTSLALVPLGAATAQQTTSYVEDAGCAFINAEEKGKTEDLPKATFPGVWKKTVQGLEMQRSWVLLLQHGEQVAGGLEWLEPYECAPGSGLLSTGILTALSG